MTTVFDARFSYEAGYKLKGDKTFHPVTLNGIQPIVIDEIDGAEAPVAYRISSKDLWKDSYDVRLRKNALWWPVYGDHGPMRAEHFMALAKTDWERANAVLDPLGRTYRCFADTFDDHFKGKIVKDLETEIELQARQVREDAARLVFIDGMLHVDAGQPTWFAVFNKGARRTFDLVIGPSSLDRQDRLGCHMPCLDRGARLTSARFGRAFGLDELGRASSFLAADAIHHVSTVVAMGIHVAGPAAEICAMAWAHHVWEAAYRSPELRRLIPALERAKDRRPPPSELPFRSLLEVVEAMDGTDAAQALPPIFAEAHLLHARLASADNAGLANDDEDALASLGACA